MLLATRLLSFGSVGPPIQLPRIRFTIAQTSCFRVVWPLPPREQEMAESSISPSFADWVLPEDVLDFDKEFTSLRNLIYLDCMGSSIATTTQISNSMDDLAQKPLGNPHSNSIVSKNSQREIEQARSRLAQHFETSLDDYHVVFTAGATASCRLVSEIYPWGNLEESRRTLVYANTSHNSVIGMRCGKKFETFDHSLLSSVTLPANANHSVSGSLVCFPAQCNFSGLKYPLENITLWQNAGYKVLLDAAGLVGTAPLSLSLHRPDFVILSFYKMFGYPSGLGALLIRKDTFGPSTASLLISNKSYFGGGTVGAVLHDSNWFKSRPNLEEALEDGTSNFHSISALKHGFRATEAVGGHAKISRHVSALAYILAYEISQLKHWNGVSLVQLHGWRSDEIDALDISKLDSIHQNHGGVVTFNVRKSDGMWVGHNEVERLANQLGFQLRTGCFCNPGACRSFLNLSSESIVHNYEKGHRCWDEHDLDSVTGAPTGSIRVSLGYFSRHSDITAFVTFLRSHFVELHPPNDARSNVGLPAQIPLIPTIPTLETISVYPIKSCAGFNPAEWTITADGLKFDREWMIVNSSNRFLNQKMEPKLTQITPVIEGDYLRVNAPGMPPLLIPLHEYPEHSMTLEVCGDTIEALVYEDQVNEWFTSFIGSGPVRLARMEPSIHRTVKTSCTTKDDAAYCEQRTIRFMNESQFLIVNRASLIGLRERIINNQLGVMGDSNGLGDVDLHLNNMRANLIVSGFPELDEDRWRAIKVGTSNLFTISGPCARCRMVSIDPVSGKSHREPLHTLSTYRRSNGKINFGVLAVHESSGDTSIIATGMEVSVTLSTDP